MQDYQWHSYAFDENDFQKHYDATINLMHDEKKKTTHPQRVKDFFCSRMALMQLIKCDKFDSLKLNSNWELDQFPDLKISLSHTKNRGVAIFSKQVNVGIDIESKMRIINPKTKKFFINEHDHTGDYSLLELWNIKEACFKCIKNKDIALLKDVTLLPDNKFQYSLGFGQFTLQHQAEYLITCASLLK
jgi:4'-phosphopantetheinyl transferase EntD